jgi:hypothetical protein
LGERYPELLATGAIGCSCRRSLLRRIRYGMEGILRWGDKIKDIFCDHLLVCVRSGEGSMPSLTLAFAVQKISTEIGS